jgi:hypothetical protein
MMARCAPDWRYEDKKHHRWVYWENRYSTVLPLGEHGRRVDYEIKTGKVRQLVWALEIDTACASKELGVPIPNRP